MNGYTQLTIEQRYQIDGLKKAGFSQTEISGELKGHKPPHQQWLYATR